MILCDFFSVKLKPLFLHYLLEFAIRFYRPLQRNKITHGHCRDVISIHPDNVMNDPVFIVRYRYEIFNPIIPFLSVDMMNLISVWDLSMRFLIDIYVMIGVLSAVASYSVLAVH